MDRAATRQSRRLVAAWLFTVAGMILVMIILGGATRLTGSGLSIMEWAPLMGTFPPSNDAEWRRLFALYQSIPQYTLVHDGFGLEGFKHIFWLEWTHRLWGRLIGVVFLLPLLALGVTARIERRLVPRLGLLFALGGLQGAVGWFMVASGFLPDTTSVSPYRLVIHLALALVLYAAIVWTGLSALYPARYRSAPPPAMVSRTIRSAGATYRWTPGKWTPGKRSAGRDSRPWRLSGLFGLQAALLVRPLAIAGCLMVSLTILAGGFTAGLHAGLIYNTFPFMDGHLVPDGYAMLNPLVRNFTENVAAVQFDHRLLATLTLISVCSLAVACWKAGLPRVLSACLAAAVLGQYAIGVTTLLLVVPVPLALLHQAGAAILLTVVLVVLHRSSSLLSRRAETLPVLESATTT